MPDNGIKFGHESRFFFFLYRYILVLLFHIQQLYMGRELLIHYSFTLIH